jgi:hypothetical protein
VVRYIETNVVSLTDYSLGGHEQGVMYPDLIISKVVPTPLSDPRVRHIIAIVEIKQAGADVGKALIQLARYAARAERMENTVLVPGSDTLPSYLLLGSKYTWLVRRPAPGGTHFFPAPWQYVFGHVDPSVQTTSFVYSMCALAISFWNLNSQIAKPSANVVSRFHSFALFSVLLFLLLYAIFWILRRTVLHGFRRICL